MDEPHALEALRGILDRPEFEVRHVLDPWGAFWGAVWTLLVDFLDWLFSPVREVARGRGGWIELAVLVLAVLVIVAGAWYVLRTVRLNMVRESAALGQGAVRRRDRSDRLWREAHELARAGRLAEATRALYLSALYALEEHDVLSVQDALTNREHADRLARARPGVATPFASVVQHYDRLRYGNRPVDAAAFDELSTLVDEARSLGGPAAPRVAAGMDVVARVSAA